MARKSYVRIAKRARGIAKISSGPVDFFRRVYGVGGLLDKEFSGNPELIFRFEESRQGKEVAGVYERLKNSSRNKSTQMVTIRMPFDLHEQLKQEASQTGVSLNVLCIRKLAVGLSSDGSGHAQETQKKT